MSLPCFPEGVGCRRRSSPGRRIGLKFSVNLSPCCGWGTTWLPASVKGAQQSSCVHHAGPVSHHGFSFLGLRGRGVSNTAKCPFPAQAPDLTREAVCVLERLCLCFFSVGGASGTAPRCSDTSVPSSSLWSPDSFSHRALTKALLCIPSMHWFCV